jgi:dTDP-4-dehydrorhamnose 3,5-epimerase
MIFHSTPLVGAFTIALEPREDKRGSFARSFCTKEFGVHGLEDKYVQSNLSRNLKAGLVRGMHFQTGLDAEVKLVRCIAGAIYDVIVDFRPHSPTYLQWFGAMLSEDNGLAMYVPRGFAHGYQSLTNGAMTHYMVSAFYAPKSEGGLRYDDPALRIEWPMEVTDLSEKDANWALIKDRK